MKSDVEKWVKIMRIGQLLSCHQMPERSFFWRGYQFPVCARCLGVIIGHLLAIIIVLFIRVPIVLGIVFCMIMFTDWFLQYIKVLESTNYRRLITGILGGMGVIVVSIKLLTELYAWFVSI